MITKSEHAHGTTINESVEECTQQFLRACAVEMHSQDLGRHEVNWRPTPVSTLRKHPASHLATTVMKNPDCLTTVFGGLPSGLP